MSKRMMGEGSVCVECGSFVSADDTLWVDPKSGKATMEGEPFHPKCAPPQHPDSCDCDFNNCRCDKGEV